MEVRAGLGVLRPLLVTLLHFLEVLVDVLPLFFAPFGAPVISKPLHFQRDLLPQRSFWPGLYVL